MVLKNRSVALDLLRAAAIFLVLGRHLTVCPPETSQAFHQITTLWHFGGWVGVDLFFVLSGFLISGLLFQEYKKHGALQVGRFLIRRGFKIYPAFWVLIFITILLDYGQSHFTWLRVGKELLFIQNYSPGLWPQTWSLAVEEHFYLLLPLLLLGLVRFAPKRENPFTRLPLLFLLLAAACLALRLLIAPRPYDFYTHGSPSHLRIDSLLFGVLIGYWLHFHTQSFLHLSRKFAALWLLLGLALFSPAFLFELGNSPFLQTFGFTILYLAGGIVLVGVIGLERDTRPTAPIRALAFIGSHSYSIYLWHLSGERWVAPFLAEKLGPLSWWTYAAVYIASALGIGIGLSMLIEWPVLRLRDHLFPSRSKALPAPSSQPSPSPQSSTTSNQAVAAPSGH